MGLLRMRGGLLMTDDDLVCFPTRVDWEMAQPPADLESFPVPLVTSKDGQENAIQHPGPVDDLAAYGVNAGWTCDITYSEGWVPHATTGKPLGPKVLWAVRMVRDGVRAVAVRTGDQWTSLWVIGARWERHETLGAFKEALA